jgi:hypothetical protein
MNLAHQLQSLISFEPGRRHVALQQLDALSISGVLFEKTTLAQTPLLLDALVDVIVADEVPLNRWLATIVLGRCPFTMPDIDALHSVALDSLFDHLQHGAQRLKILYASRSVLCFLYSFIMFC